VSSSKRERELARQKFERQQARRAEAHARRKRRNAIVASALGVVAVVAAVAFLGIGLGGDDENTAAASAPTDTASPTPTESATAQAAVLPCAYTAGGEPAKPVTLPVFDAAAAAQPYTATLQTSQGGITFTADTAGAPCATYSFRYLSEQGFFEGTDCHRLSSNESFGVLQCGDPTGTGSGGPGYSFPDENLDSLADLTYPKGTIAMANSGPNTNGSQFFIVWKDTTLPPSYTPFGTVTAGLDVVEQVAADGTADGSTDGPPKTGVQIEGIQIAPA
jgi:peptidyl-prolyl cis-trans isomerase B (cyclophilin B)